MNEILLVIGAILFFVGFFVGQSAGKEKGKVEGLATGKAEGYRLGVEAGQGAALPLQDLPTGTYPVVDTIQGKANPTVVFLLVRVPKDEPLYDERGEIITLVLPKGADPLPAVPFLLTKDASGGITYRPTRAGSGMSL